MGTGRRKIGKRQQLIHAGLLVLPALLMMLSPLAAAGEEAGAAGETGTDRLEAVTEAEAVVGDEFILGDEFAMGDEFAIGGEDAAAEDFIFGDEDVFEDESFIEDETEPEDLFDEPLEWEETILEEQEEKAAGASVTIEVYNRTINDWGPIALYSGCDASTNDRNYRLTKNGTTVGFVSIEWLKKNTGTGEYIKDNTEKFSEGKWRCDLLLNGVSASNIHDGSSGEGRINFAGFPDTTVWQGNGNSDGYVTYHTFFTVTDRINNFEVNLQGTMPETEVGAPATVPLLTAASGEDLEEKGISIKEVYWFEYPVDTDNWWNLPKLGSDARFGAGRYCFAVRITCSNPKYRLDEIWTSVRVNDSSVSNLSTILYDGSLLVAEMYTIDKLGTKDGIKYKALDSKAKTAAAIGTDSATLPADVVVPSQVTFRGETYTVTELDCTFMYSGAVTIQIPATVTTLKGDDDLGEGVFYECWHLKSVTFADGCPVTELGDSCFRGCGVLKQVKLPGSLKKINTYAFEMCKQLQSITIPAATEEIGIYAFAYCESMKEVIIPENSRLKKIGNRAFFSCDLLTELALPASLETIDVRAFAECSALSKVTFPKGSAIKTIADEAFGYNTGSKPIQLVYVEGDTAVKTVIDKYIAWAKGKGWSHVTTNLLSDIGTGVISAIASQVYTGKALIPKVSVTCKGRTLAEGTDYTLVRTNNINVGTATVTLKGKGAYGGTLQKTFDIIPKGTSLSKLTKGKKKIKVKWKTQKNQTDGYEIQYSTKKKFNKSVKTKKVTGAGKKSVTIKKLKARKKYYVRIRTWKKVGSKVYYSNWSKVKKVKTK